MTKGKGRIPDRDFEEGIANRAGELQREAQHDIARAKKEAYDDFAKAKKYAYQKNDEIETMISEHPKAFVLGSFIGGFALGTLFSKGNR